MDARTNWMIYGANGYTGRLLADEAVRRGGTPILAGRRHDAIQGLTSGLGCEAWLRRYQGTAAEAIGSWKNTSASVSPSPR